MISYKNTRTTLYPQSRSRYPISLKLAKNYTFAPTHKREYMKNITLSFAIAFALLSGACNSAPKETKEEVKETKVVIPYVEPQVLDSTIIIENGLYAKMSTSKGDILIQLEFVKTPLTVASFVGLAEGKIENTAQSQGTPYFNGLTFHRVIPNFMIQGGDPQGVGTGGPGYSFKDEIDLAKYPELNHSTPGVLSMANSGPATNGSQFFLTVAPTPGLDGKHTVFGRIIDGYDIAVDISNVPRGRRDMPNAPVFINNIKIIRVGESAKNFNAAKNFQELR